MRRIHRSLCALLALALAALALLPAGAAAAGDGVAIDAEHFPDANLRAWLTDPAHLDGAGKDGVFSAEELAAVTKLDLSGQRIADLTGIEYFTALEVLNVNNNLLTRLDLRGNPGLRELYCTTNTLTSLDVTGCGELTALNCERNKLTELDLAAIPGWNGCTAATTR